MRTFKHHNQITKHLISSQLLYHVQQKQIMEHHTISRNNLTIILFLENRQTFRATIYSFSSKHRQPKFSLRHFVVEGIAPTNLLSAVFNPFSVTQLFNYTNIFILIFLLLLRYLNSAFLLLFLYFHLIKASSVVTFIFLFNLCIFMASTPPGRTHHEIYFTIFPS